jgi:predicted nucleic-acid-binding Zn-ribbon protein
MANEVKCPKCETKMVDGLIIDQTDYLKKDQVWVEGNPERSSWSNQMKTGNTSAYNVITLRCPACWYLESYTNEKVFI